MKKDRYFFIKDIECTIIVESMSRKRLLYWLDDYVECINQNNQYHTNIYDVEDETYEILYTDGTTDYIDCNYDGHKIKRINIVSIVNSNANSYIVYGNFEVSETGVIYAAAEEKIDDTNIVEVDRYIA